MIFVFAGGLFDFGEELDFQTNQNCEIILIRDDGARVCLDSFPRKEPTFTRRVACWEKITVKDYQPACVHTGFYTFSKNIEKWELLKRIWLESVAKFDINLNFSTTFYDQVFAI